MSSPKPAADRCRYLLLTLAALLVVYPFLLEGALQRTLLLVLNSAILVAAVVAVGDTTRHKGIAVAIAVPWLLLAWAEELVGLEQIDTTLTLLTIVFYGYAALRVLSYVLTGDEVTRDKIYGAACVYLLLGLVWSSYYYLLHTVQPGAFSVDGSLEFEEFVYFSFVTLTTLGYGDITPVAATARSAVLLEAVAGVLYVSVLVARLVGLYQSEARA